ncbi:MAG: hypothetical protein KC502_23115 [Myxococcales bacterium]|nr:hypothetical protein [Myxococcales bacterium]
MASRAIRLGVHSPTQRTIPTIQSILGGGKSYPYSMELPRRSLLASLILLAFTAGVAVSLFLVRSDESQVKQPATPQACVETHLHVSSRGSWVQLPQLSRLMDFGDHSRTIYLNREGATLRAGADDASDNRSSVVRAVGLTMAEVPAFAGTTAQWNELVACIRGRFAAFDVRITDKRPLHSESYLMAVFGGDARVLGRPGAHDVGGLAPFNGEPIPRSVVYIFSEALHRDVAAMCDTGAMELAHAFGLDHAYDCAEVMSYLPRCGTRSFLDQETPCGEYTPRLCGNGAATQNSHQYLLSLLGPARSARARSNPKRLVRKSWPSPQPFAGPVPDTKRPPSRSSAAEP